MVLQFATVLGTPYMAFSKHFPVFFTGKGKKNPITDMDRPWGFQEVEAARFQNSRHRMVVRSALRTGRLYP